MQIELHARARHCGLSYVCVEDLSIERRRHGRGFSYRDGEGRLVTDRDLRRRFADLAIPPAWKEVWLALDPHAHLQAVGRDADGRLQYRYHDDWKEVRDEIKAERLMTFGRALPAIREKIEADLRRRTLDRDFSAAVAARLVDKALLRSGHRAEKGEESARGATTLLKRDVKTNGRSVSLAFIGKSGKAIRKKVPDPLLPSRLRKLKQIGRKRLFAYRTEEGKCAYLTARDLNQYLRDAAGAPVSSKDFRTFAASAAALEEFAQMAPPQTKTAHQRAIAAVMREVSEKLANTMAVCRSSYVHPLVVEAFEAGKLEADLLHGPHRTRLSPGETALMRFLEKELSSGNARRPTPVDSARHDKEMHP
ncbi:DNA topoisomerase IB [Afifella sp. IM 167]|uniref:DNA topoisomerase IB n=1 Tax=Afifella sp. IM 167 TaxID=2033586 RepID=UPI001CCDD36D|nr:DNA topoisomerase IB [Afifella sp. IM 167]MBZ8135287.1 DNA topoisomerase I [Afifella sp. IM 167]